ncbi:MAG: tetratricopeptide repeat protein [Bacteroidaceae bacterium]|nr:tetratricopeptide repeat protein [Bacteroidaceae bacterium]
MKKLGLILVGALIANSSVIAQTTDGQAEIANIAELLKSNNTAGATEAAKQAVKKNKKNLNFVIAVAQEFVKAKNFAVAEEYYNKAKSLNSKSADVYVLGGDIQAAQGKGGEACSLYEQAIYFDAKNANAYYKYSEAYTKSNPTLAIQKLEELAQQCPELANESNKRIAAIYYYNNRFADAAKAYHKVNTADLSDEEIIYQATSYFFAGDTDNSIEIAKAGHDKNPRKGQFNRLLMFNNVSKKDYEAAVAAGNDLFNNSDPLPYTAYDHNFYAQALLGAKKYDEAVEQFKKAYDLDTTANRNETLQLISNAYESKGDYKSAIEYYDKYEANLAPEAQTVAVLFQRAQLYYSMGGDEAYTADERKAANVKADECFKEVSEKAPDNYLGYLWRGRTNAQLDPETDKGLAKPHYEKAAQILESQANPANNSKLIECYRYLCYYYFKKNGEKKDALSIEYRNKIAAIDPNNAFITATAPAFK